MSSLTKQYPMQKVHLPRRSCGFSLIEAMIAAFIFATGILGIAGLQMKSLGMLANSSSMGAAMVSANDLAERMLANPEAVSEGFYDSLDGSLVSDPGCGSSCSPEQLATLDVYNVYQQVNLDLSEGNLTVNNIGNNVFTIDVTWLERIGEESDTKRHRISFLPYDP